MSSAELLSNNPCADILILDKRILPRIPSSWRAFKERSTGFKTGFICYRKTKTLRTPRTIPRAQNPDDVGAVAKPTTSCRPKQMPRWYWMD